MIQQLMRNGLASACLRKLNGKRRPGVDCRVSDTRGEMKLLIQVVCTGQIMIQVMMLRMVMHILRLWGAFRPMAMVCMTWQGMCGNGALIGMTTDTMQIHRIIVR